MSPFSCYMIHGMIQCLSMCRAHFVLFINFSADNLFLLDYLFSFSAILTRPIMIFFLFHPVYHFHFQFDRIALILIISQYWCCAIDIFYTLYLSSVQPVNMTHMKFDTDLFIPNVIHIFYNSLQRYLIHLFSYFNIIKRIECNL